jgi:hypothetical protein
MSRSDSFLDVQRPVGTKRCKTVLVVYRWCQGEKMIKLNLIFIAMDLLSLLVYPIIFVHGKLRGFSKSNGNIVLGNVLASESVAPALVE